jgi:hypothetical protein
MENLVRDPGRSFSQTEDLLDLRASCIALCAIDASEMIVVLNLWATLSLQSAEHAAKVFRVELRPVLCSTAPSLINRKLSAATSTQMPQYRHVALFVALNWSIGSRCIAGEVRFNSTVMWSLCGRAADVEFMSVDVVGSSAIDGEEGRFLY